ncbi:MAG: hypothetical protein DMD81_03560 [Candidatus Rokuibacteriota bacterium]|nr:MAG: hypothetical protein DMD81_03560 [Candidatus Rokubacteria bacterium]
MFPEEALVNAVCECGMTLDRPRSRTQCSDCGTGMCRSCSIEVDGVTYCRWCVTSIGRAA